METKVTKQPQQSKILIFLVLFSDALTVLKVFLKKMPLLLRIINEKKMSIVDKETFSIQQQS